LIKKGYVRLKLTTLNRDRVIEKLKKSDVLLLNIKKIGQKYIYLTIPSKDLTKVFAITNILCYNTLIVGRFGLNGFFDLAKRSIGIILGALVFIFSAIYSSSYVFAIDVKGDAISKSVFIKKYLSDHGVTKFTKYADIDLDALQDLMLKDNGYLSYVSLKRQGLRLVVTAYLTKNEGKSDIDTAPMLTSTVDGVITFLKVYSGQAQVKVGDTVNKGDILIDGVIKNGDVDIPVGVYALVKVKTSRRYVYYLTDDKSSNLAIAFSQGEFAYAYDEVKVTYFKENGRHRYDVELFFTVTLFSG
jgi:similar to stage IV sporulation protein